MLECLEEARDGGARAEGRAAAAGVLHGGEGRDEGRGIHGHKSEQGVAAEAAAAAAEIDEGIRRHVAVVRGTRDGQLRVYVIVRKGRRRRRGWWRALLTGRSWARIKSRRRGRSSRSSSSRNRRGDEGGREE